MPAPRSFLAAALPLLASAAVLAAYWPGVMTWDAAREYRMALGGPIDDWHPPVMIWLWRRLLPVARGPGPMLVVQLGLYLLGWALLARWAARSGRGGLAFTLGSCALMPIGLELQGVVLKDCLMAGALLVAAGLILAGGAGRRLAAIALLLFAATLRFNAFLACLPLLWAALPQGWSKARRAAALAVGTLALLAAMPIANRLIGARSSGVELSQMLFDLGGITYFAGVDAFPPVDGIPDPVAVNARCYDPTLWDAYAWWTDAPCPIGWANAGRWLTTRHGGAVGWWLLKMSEDPIAYAEHRLAHFNRNVRLWVPDGPVAVTPPRPEPNPFGYEIASNRAEGIIGTLAAAQARSPLGWPAWWMAVAGGVLILAPALPSRRAIVPLAASALLYGGGYLALSVASDLRYHLWTMMAALTAAAIAAADLATGVQPGRRSATVAVAPVLTVTLIGLIARSMLAS